VFSVLELCCVNTQHKFLHTLYLYDIHVDVHGIHIHVKCSLENKAKQSIYEYITFKLLADVYTTCYKPGRIDIHILTVTLKQQYKNIHKLQFNNWMNSPYMMARSH
jgi:hypothetical protein